MKPIYEKQREYFQDYRDQYNEQLDEDKKSTISLKKILVSDCTPESLCGILFNNQRGIGLVSDELNGWFNSFNRYNKGNEEEFWLSNFSGTPLTVDRKSSEPLYVMNPFISVCGTIQTKLLKQWVTGNKGVNGFIDRVLMVMPQGLKKEYFNDTDVDDEIIEKCGRIINKILETDLPENEAGDLSPIVLEYTPSAKKMLKDWMNLNANQINGTDRDELKGLYTKLEIYCVRFSLILQVIHDTCNSNEIEEINDQSVAGAIELTNYFQRMGEQVHDDIAESSPLNKLTATKKQFYTSLGDVVNTGETVIKGLKVPFSLSKSTIKRMLNCS